MEISKAGFSALYEAGAKSVSRMKKLHPKMDEAQERLGELKQFLLVKTKEAEKTKAKICGVCDF